MKKPTRILFIIDELEIGGAQTQIFLLGEEMRKLGCEVAVAFFREAGAVLAPALHHAGFSVIPLNKTRRIDVGFVIRLRRLLRKERLTKVLSFGYSSNLWTRLAVIGAQGPRIVACVRDHTYLPLVPRPFERVLILIEHLLSRKSHCVVTNSSAAAASLVARGVISPATIRVIPNGIDIRSFATHAEARARLEALAPDGIGPIIGCMARLVAEKDHMTLVRAARIVVDSVPSARFVIAGQGPEKQRIEELIARLKLERNVILPGTLVSSQYLAGFDVAVLSSIVEGMPNFLLEAMATGVPLVASRVGAVPEILEDGRLGLVVLPQDPEALAAGILAILRSPQEAKRKAGDALLKARSMSPSLQAQRFLSLLA